MTFFNTIRRLFGPRTLLAAAVAASLAAAPVSAQTMKVGDVVPADLAVTDHLGKEHTFGEFRGKTTVLEWTNFGCPFVRKHYDSKNMQNLQAKYTGQGVVWLSVISSAEGREGYLTTKDAPAAIAKEGSKATAVILDGKGTLGRMFGANNTPTMAVLDGNGTLVYFGAIDSIPSFSQEDIASATNYVAQALDELAAGKPVSMSHTNPYGCSVKY